MNNHVNARNDLINYLKRDQFGPYGGEVEELPENPLRRYMVGILHPQGSTFTEAKNDGGVGGESGTKADDTEMGLSMSNTLAPSSFGLSFACSNEIDAVEVYVSAGKYLPAEISHMEADSSPDGNKTVKWKREDIRWSGPIFINEAGDQKKLLFGECLTIRARVRSVDKFGKRSVTLSVVNEQKCSADSRQKDRALRSFFQVAFGAVSLDEKFPFVNRTTGITDSSVSEENALRLIYRNIHTYAVGHGCSADWEKDSEKERCRSVFSSFVPTHTVYPMIQPKDYGLPEYSLKEISESSLPDLQSLLSVIPESYSYWIEDLEKQIPALDKNLQPQAKEHIRLCCEASNRIRNGIDLLGEDEMVFSAFILMHKAMLQQVARSQWIKNNYPEEGPQLTNEHAWYPFQIAFILQNLPSLVDPGSDDRNTVDLLWFPTGGGKTEAYLGIIAFMLFFRRLRSLKKGGNGGGTSALMRYTLRLLTVDQFYRAALLICACETIRQDASVSIAGTAPISIGLWVGSEACPNTRKDAREKLEAIKKGHDAGESGDPLKIKQCPWCGTEIIPSDYEIPDKVNPMRINCPNSKCNFNEGLPIWLIDTDVYHFRPSLIIGTADKFARIPWVKEAGNIFGCDGKSEPPELIIQDELHLISGPLGTLAGLYETAVDKLCCSKDGFGPKIIASTATIRNAERQVKDLFCRKVAQFPPAGLNYNNSFFAKEDRNAPGRIYAGVFTPGTSPTTALVRTFGILLHGGKKIEYDDGVRDAYWTLMGYFNSLRELGGASVQVEDDVNDYLKVCAERDGDKNDYRMVQYKKELTGRVPSAELDEIRLGLSNSFPDETCYDAVLATNMISVGLDVPRLGVMAVVGQPKSTSEYIQATSRIGRRFPGLVVVLYNWTRSRDRSHYERFNAYHSKLYSEVEATSVTPFSSRARDRGLHAVVISLVRHLIPSMRDNSAAVEFKGNSDAVKQMVKYILERVNNIDDKETFDTKKALEEILDKWDRLALDGDLEYQKKGIKDVRSLMIPIEKIKLDSNSFGTLNSLRNIDPAAGLKLEG